MRALRSLLIYAVYGIPALAMWALGWRLLKLTNPDRVGHLAAEPDCIAKEERLGWFAPRNALLLAPRGAVANERLVDYWTSVFRTVRSPLLCRILSPINRFPFVRLRDDMAVYVAAIDRTAAFMEIQKAWGDRAGILQLTLDDAKRGAAQLERLGVPPGRPFICLHSREGGYSPRDEHIQDFRNTTIENYARAVGALYERGIYCVRMGDPSMKPAPRMPGLIDYAHSALRSDWMDVFLCARCEFFLGTSSGLLFLAQAFGRGVCATNMVPFSSVLPFGARDLGIPKLLRSERDARLLTFAEILTTPVGDFRYSYLYQQSGLTAVENLPDEIEAVALEMLSRVRGEASYSAADDELQRRFRALMRPGHNSYGSAARVGRDFLRKYEHLFGDRPQA